MRAWIPTLTVCFVGSVLVVVTARALGVDPVSDAGMLMAAPFILLAIVVQTVVDFRRGIHGPWRKGPRRRELGGPL